MIGPAEIDETMADDADGSGPGRPPARSLFVSEPSTGHNGAAAPSGAVRGGASPSFTHDVVPPGSDDRVRAGRSRALAESRRPHATDEAH